MGAWIETLMGTLTKTQTNVAPLVGAWIETVVKANESSADAKSHPSWVRGLKQQLAKIGETYLESHPSWVRGLKLCGGDFINNAARRTPRGCVD